MTNQSRAFFALDFGSATTAGSVLGLVGGRWRLIAHAAMPSHVDVDAMLAGLLTQVGLTDPEMLVELGGSADIPSHVATWPRLAARTTPPRRIAGLAGSRRQRRRLELAALRAGWLVVGGSADEDDPVVLSRLALSTETGAVLLGADRSPGNDEKRHLPDLAVLLAAVARCRPELTVVLAGGAAAYEAEFSAPRDAQPGYELATGPTRAVPVIGSSVAPVESTTEKAPVRTKKASKKAAAAGQAAAGDSPPAYVAKLGGGVTESAAGATAVAGANPPPVASMPLPQASVGPDFQPGSDRGVSAYVLLAPDAEAGQPAGASLQQVLEGLRAFPDDSRLAVARSIASLSYVLDRSIEVVEIGLQGGLRSRSEPVGQGHFAVVSSHACLADASFAPENPSEEAIDGVLAWSTTVLDRHRVMDRLNDLRLVPWGEADGDGAAFRLAAAKAACGRLVDATPEIAVHPMPELLVAAGGVFAAMPPSVVALALADLFRRPGVSQLASDQARLLGPLGVIDDEAERRQLMANLADDILMPLGSLILPAGVRQGRSAGSLRLKDGSSNSEIELHAGAVQVVDLPPGRAARVNLDFRDAVRLGNRGHRFSVDVAGGLGGLLVDLRDIPLRVSDRPDSRRAALDAWQRGMWPEIDE